MEVLIVFLRVSSCPCVSSGLFAVRRIAARAFCLLLAGSRSARMAKSLALGFGAERARLGSRAGGILPLMLAFLLAGRQRKQRAEHQSKRKKCNQNSSRSLHRKNLLKKFSKKITHLLETVVWSNGRLPKVGFKDETIIALIKNKINRFLTVFFLYKESLYLLTKL
jgi:hypothetical protein